MEFSTRKKIIPKNLENHNSGMVKTCFAGHKFL